MAVKKQSTWKRVWSKLNRRQKIVASAAAAALLVVIVVWLAGEMIITRANPPARYTGVILTPEADQVLRRACYDCHSNETQYPAYSYLPFVSILLARDVKSGRHEMNFSEWDRVSHDDQVDLADDILNEVHGGRMPPTGYRMMHPVSALSETDIKLLEQAAAQVYGVKPDGKDKPAKQ